MRQPAHVCATALASAKQSVWQVVNLPTMTLTKLCSALQCICEDLEATAEVDGSDGGDISALAWSPRCGRGEERVAVARGATVSILGFCSVDDDDDDMEGNNSGSLECSQVSSSALLECAQACFCACCMLLTIAIDILLLVL